MVRAGPHSPDDVLTVIFTSGTTGKPKGVMLTHRNVGSNIDAIDEVLGLRKDDVLMAILPFFHSFGYTATLWTILSTDSKASITTTRSMPGRSANSAANTGRRSSWPRPRSCART